MGQGVDLYNFDQTNVLHNQTNIIVVVVIIGSGRFTSFDVFKARIPAFYPAGIARHTHPWYLNKERSPEPGNSALTIGIQSPMSNRKSRNPALPFQSIWEYWFVRRRPLARLEPPPPSHRPSMEEPAGFPFKNVQDTIRQVKLILIKSNRMCEQR